MSKQATQIGPLSLEKCLDLMYANRNRSRWTIAPNTVMMGCGRGGVVIHFHNTLILHYRLDGAVVVTTFGFETVTTKQRLNAFLGRGTIHAKNHQWFIHNRPFHSGHVIPPAKWFQALAMSDVKANAPIEIVCDRLIDLGEPELAEYVRSNAQEFGHYRENPV